MSAANSASHNPSAPPAPPPAGDIAARIADLDVTLFDAIATQTSRRDRQSLLALQHATRRHFGKYVYLEIGSHLGGSIQPHLCDPLCATIYSIDPRPAAQPDNIGRVFHYENNSTQRMLENLRQLNAAQVAKITTFDSDARDIDRALIKEPPHLCFIDGEHTVAAVLSDFAFCRRVVRADGLIAFHDADRIIPALKTICRQLKSDRVKYQPLMLSGSVFAIAMGDAAISQDPLLRKLTRSHRFYFWQKTLRLSYKTQMKQWGV